MRELFIDPEVAERVDRIEIPWSAAGVDPYGVDRVTLGRFMTALRWLYRSYFRVRVSGKEHIPPRGRAMLVGNHSGGVAIDGAMVVASCLLELEPPRLAQGMAEKFIEHMPFGGTIAARCGQFTGLPENALRLLEDDRLLMVFPEGARGTAKLFHERDSLVEFGTGFVRLALQTGAPIIPFGVVGAGDALPTVYNAYGLGRAFGVPYLPFTPWLLPVPVPARISIHYGEPLHLSGTGREDDEVVSGYVQEVKDRIAGLIEYGRRST